MEDVGCVDEEVRPEVLGQRRPDQVEHVAGELGLRVLPGEVGVRLREARLRERRHRHRARERLGQEDRVRVGGAHLRDQPLPEGQRLGVRVVDPEDAHAAGDPEEHDVEQGLPEPAPVLGVEVEVVDVLVALGRVLGVLERPVGPVVEPLGVLPEPRVVGGALDREVERHLDAELRAARDKPFEVGERAEPGIDRCVPACLRADRPRAPGVAGRRDEGVVSALAVRVADRVDRGEVEHVEAELGEGRQHLLHAAKAAERAGEELVPGPDPGALAVDVDREHRPRHGLGAVLGRVREALIKGQRGAAEQSRALGQHAREVGLARLDLPQELAPPGGCAIDPRLDRELPAAELGRDEHRRPAVARVGLHRDPQPPSRACGAVLDLRAEHLVAVAEDVRPHGDGLAERPLDRVAAAVEDGPRILDLGPRRAGRALRRHLRRNQYQVRTALWTFGGRAASCSTRRRFQEAAWAGRPSGSSTGWPRQDSRGGRSCRSGPRTATARPTAPLRRSRPRPRCSPTRRRR